MRVVDVDSHFHEPLDWLERQDPALAAELPPPQRFLDMLRTMLVGQTQGMPEEDRPDDPLELMPADLREHMAKCDALQPEHYDAASGNPFYCMDARVAHGDSVGVDVQWLNPGGPPICALQQLLIGGKKDLIRRLKTAWNTFAAEHVADYRDRLQPVTQIDIEDVDGSVRELTRMREAGSRAFDIQMHPTKSLTHADFDPLWSAAEDLGMAAYVHVTFGQSAPHPSWNNDGGRGGSTSFFGGIGMPSDQRSELRNLFTAFVLHGVFERHPKLRIVTGETGYSWLPQYVKEIDCRGPSTLGLDGLPKEDTYDLRLLPSEYLQRHVRIGALVGYIDRGVECLSLAEAMDALPDPGMIVFTTDYPHPEGRPNAMECFEQLLPDDAKLRERFFGGSMEEALGGL